MFSMFSTKSAVLIATSAALMVAGAETPERTDFVMVDYVPPLPVDGNDPRNRSAFFWPVTKAGLAPNPCEIGKLWDYKETVNDDEHVGVRVVGNYTDPEAVEVNWGKGQGTGVTYRRDTFGSRQDHGLWDLDNRLMGKCQVANPGYSKRGCVQNGVLGTVNYLLLCHGSYFHAPDNYTTGPKNYDLHSNKVFDTTNDSYENLEFDLP
ncbi:hypothetical protein PG994_012242 [Apiospora phragmitis]|uniref:Secreted protein n=1 Tax=Apiospora phragmitis TaxID=2905665 RepID=A0ABR1TVG5_9PEZI